MTTSVSVQMGNLLRNKFGHKTFRPQQEEIIKSILEGRDVVAVMATSSGKSLCYQLPALLLDGITIVISPLIALMRDQVRGLLDKKITSCCLYSEQSDTEQAKQWELLREGTAKILYVSPEKLATASFYKELGSLVVSQLVVDEGHCVSMWGHDFRKDYQLIPQARKKLGNPTMSVFTATAPLRTREDMVKMLELDNAQVIIGQIERENLSLAVRRFDTGYEKELELVLLLKQAIRKKLRTVVYCQKTTTVDALSEQLDKLHGITVLGYHGKMDAQKRREVEQEFSSRKGVILLATKAFGMGVDIPDIRLIVHYNMPDSIEEYWQQVGRAGRDGKESECVLLYTRYDALALSKAIDLAHPSLEYVKRIWSRLITYTKHDSRVDKEYPITKRFYQGHFVESNCENQALLRSKIVSALAILQEFGMVTFSQGNATFHISPKDAVDAFPINENNLQVRKLRAVERLGRMAYAVRQCVDSSATPMMELIHGHFVNNTVDIDGCGWHVLQDVTPCISDEVLNALKEKDFELSELSSLLRGVESATKGSKKTPEKEAPLKKYSADEFRMELECLEALGLVRSVELGSKHYLTIGPNAGDVLKTLRPSTDIASLKQRMLLEIEKPTLVEAVDGWWRLNNSDCQPEKWWQRIKEFLTERFTVLGKNLSGLELAAAYLHTKAVSRVEAKAASSTGKSNAGVTLTGAKQFLNYLFNNKIRT